MNQIKLKYKEITTEKDGTGNIKIIFEEKTITKWLD